MVAPLSQLDLLVFGEESSIGLSDHESKVGRSRLRSPRLVFDAMKGKPRGGLIGFRSPSVLTAVKGTTHSRHPALGSVRSRYDRRMHPVSVCEDMASEGVCRLSSLDQYTRSDWSR